MMSGPAVRAHRVPWLFVPAALAVLCSYLVVTSARGTLAQWIAVNALLALVPFMVSLSQNRLDVFSPPVVFSLGFSVLFVARPLAEEATPSLTSGLLGYDYETHLPDALRVAALGAVAFFAGYYLGPGRRWGTRLPKPGLNGEEPGLKRVIAAVAAVAAFLFSLFVASSGGVSFLRTLFDGRSAKVGSAFASSSGYLYSALYALASCGLLLLVTNRGARPGQRLAAGLLILASLTTALGPGDRSVLVPVLMACVVAYFARRGRRPRLLTSALAGLVLFPLLISLPQAYRETASMGRSFGDVFATVADEPVAGLQRFLLGGDTAMVDNLAIQLQVVPDDLDYTYGSTYVAALARPVPRQLWAEKPVSADQLLNAAAFPSTSRQGIGFSFSIFGEPYLNAGLLGVALVLAAFGCLYRALYTWFMRSRDNAYAIVAYALSLAYVLVYIRGGIGVDYQRQLIHVGPLLVVYYLHRRHLRRGTA